MANDDMVRHLYDQLMTINEEAFATGLFNVAFHALNAALHCARQLQDDVALKRIEDMANAQLEWIDRNAPGYEHSTASAKLRGHESVFHTLALEASTRAEMISQHRK